MRTPSLTLLILCFATACGGSGSPPPFDGDPAFVSWGHVPYIESVSFPEHITVGQFFDITIGISVAADPSIVAGLGPRDHGGILELPDLTDPWTFTLNLFPAVYKANGGAPCLSFIRTDRIDVPGEYKLQVLSARTRELGGSKVQVEYQPTPGVYLTPDFVYKEFPFTVEPAPAP